MALAENKSQGGYLRDVSLNWAGDDYSNPSAATSQANPYRTGDYYTVSGRADVGLGLGKVLIYSSLAIAGYWIFKRIKK